jgi:beta-glucanase (GH16 family)
LSAESGLQNFGIDFSAHFHQFSIEWDRDSIRWFVDNQQFHNETLIRSFWSKKGVNPYTSIRQPFDQKFQFTFDVMA